MLLSTTNPTLFELGIALTIGGALILFACYVFWKGTRG